LLFEVIAGPENGDPFAAPVPLRHFDRATLRKTRIGYYEDDGRTPVTPETRAAVKRAAQVLRDDGFAVDYFLPKGLDEALRLLHVLFIDGISVLLRQAYKGRESEMYAIVREVLDFADRDSALTMQSLMDTLLGRDALRYRFLEQMDHYPILLCPVSAGPAFRHKERSWIIEGKTINYLDSFSYSQCFNLLGNPAAVVPMGVSPEGMPIGIQIVGRPWEEERVLAVAACLERANEWRAPSMISEVAESVS